LNRIKPAVLSALFLFLSCGIEEYYYLPQVPEGNIISQSTTNATIMLPALNPVDYHYATNYSIFYRIYISEEETTSIPDSAERNRINPALARDFNSLSSYTDTSNSSLVTNENTFRSFNYYEIKLDGEKVEVIFTKNGGTLRILFPTSSGSRPTVSLVGVKDNISLLRSSESDFYLPPAERFFINTSELNNNDSKDVAALPSGSHAYVSMYIAARGMDELFRPIYGKPTHINIFRLPDNN
jgi:hypothetical protein